MKTPTWPEFSRAALFAVGIAGIAHEAFIRTGEIRIPLLMFLGAMVGLPVPWRRDDQRNQRRDDDA